MRNNKYIFFLLHALLFLAALAFHSLTMFFVFAALAGIIPRKRKKFGYFFLAALVAMAAMLVLNIPETALNERLSDSMGLGPVPFWALVGFISLITLSLTAMAVNSLLTPAHKVAG